MELKRIIKDISPDIIHSVTLKSILLSNLVLLFKRKVNKVNAVSGMGYLFTSNRVSIALYGLKFILRVLIKLGRPHFIFQNLDDLKEFKKLGVNDNYNLIRGSGVNHKEFKYTPPKTNEKVNITFTGRILKDKGILELIKAIEILPKEIRSKVVLNIYGKIDLDNPAHITEKELKKLLKPNFIVWHGNTNDIKSVLALSDIYCLPSYREGLPKSTLEAMAIGRPIVTTNAPGCEDTVLEGINGFKVDIKDYKALSEKLQLLIEDEPLRIKMGKKSREIFEENFTLDKVVKQTFELYDSLIVKN
jgi:glycosyltransferase involved in cell wall biosynthesis